MAQGFREFGPSLQNYLIDSLQGVRFRDCIGIGLENSAVGMVDDHA